MRLNPRLVCLFVLALWPQPAQAQQSTRDVLGFLLTNRSIPTDDFERDARATAQTRDAISVFLANELGRLPITSGAGGFTYRLNPALGVMERSSDSFGPFYVERSLTTGSRHASLSVVFESTSFKNIDGRSLRDGTLVSTASQLRGETVPFDVETLTLQLKTSTVAVLGTFGITDRLDVGVAAPFVNVSLNGQRYDTYRGQTTLQASATSSSSGLGDMAIRAKYNFLRRQGVGLSAGAEARLPTGRSDDLLGAGSASVQPRLIVSVENSRTGAHFVVGPVFGGSANELDYAAGLTVTGSARLTLVTEIMGRHVSLGGLTDTTEPHPSLALVDTIRLSSVSRDTNRVLAVVGVKWNVAGTWLVDAHAQRSLTSAGLNAGWSPSVTLDYSFGR
ncbi:MAG: transporter [Vicinamibacterales bacterium]